MANLKNLATGTVLTAPSPATSGTSLVLQAGEGARMPAVNFYAILHPDGSYPTLDNAEIVLVTAKSTDTLTITRAQLSTSAQSVAVGWRVSNPFLKEDYDAKQDLDSDLTTIAGLTATTDNFMVATASAWASRTPTQARAQMGLGAVALLASVDLTANVTGILPVANGGSGRNTATTAYGLLSAGTTAAGIHQTLPAGATTEILVGGGSSALPVWTTAQGSGAPVRATSPTLVTPALGTPASGVMTNVTGLPNAGLATGAGQPGGAWTSWTPTLTNLSGGTQTYAKYSQVGKTIHFRFKYTLAGAGVAGLVSFTVPVNFHADYSATDVVNASVIFYDVSVTTPYQGSAFSASSSTISLKVLHTDGTRGNNEATSSTNPFTYATGDIIYCSGTYEAA